MVIIFSLITNKMSYIAFFFSVRHFLRINIIFTSYMYMHNIFKSFKNVQYVGPTWPLSVQALMLQTMHFILPSLFCNDILVT